MIAKPTKKTLPIAIAFILILALLGWLSEKSKHNDHKEKAPQAVEE